MTTATTTTTTSSSASFIPSLYEDIISVREGNNIPSHLNVSYKKGMVWSLKWKDSIVTIDKHMNHICLYDIKKDFENTLYYNMFKENRMSKYTCCIGGDILYIVGGYEKYETDAGYDIELPHGVDTFNLITLQWGSIKLPDRDFSIPDIGFSISIESPAICIRSNGNLLIVGGKKISYGCRHGSYLKKKSYMFAEYDISKCEWIERPELLEGNSCTGMICELNSKVYYVNRVKSLLCIDGDDIDVICCFDYATMKWTLTQMII
jgi:hypothetical protein